MTHTNRAVDSPGPGAALRRAAAVIALALSGLTSISPLFGDKGIASVIPLPSTLAGIGRPLITVISLAVTLLAAKNFLSGDARRWKTVLGAVTILVALSMLAMYMTWIETGGMVNVPLMPSQYGNVIAVFVVGLAVALLALGLTVLASQLANVASAPVATAYPSESINLETSPVDSNEDLLTLVLTANWNAIKEKSRIPTNTYWRLYGAVARLIIDTRQDEAELRRARFWTRVLGLANVLRLKRNDTKWILIHRAEAMLPYLSIKNEAWRKIDAVGGSPKDWSSAFQAYQTKFLFTIKAVPIIIGHARSIDDDEKAITELLTFKQNVPHWERFKILNGLYMTTSLLGLQDFGKAGLERTQSKFDQSVISAVSRDDRVQIAKAGYDAAEELLGLQRAYPQHSIAWFSASNAVSQAYCLAVGADQRQDNARKLGALAYMTCRSAELLHIDAKEMANRMAAVAASMRKDGVDVPDRIQGEVEAALLRVDRLPKSLFAALS